MSALSVKEHLIQGFKINYSNTWQTTLSITFIVVISVILTTWFLWRSLYLPELKNHARYLTTELIILDDIHQNGYGSTEERQRLRSKMHTIYVDDPTKFPNVEDKIFAGFFTNILQREVESQIGRPVVVFFKFKPTAQLWIHDSKYENYWINEPVIYYSNLNPIILYLLILAIPVMSVMTIIWLVRQLNRPLKTLQLAASNYTKFGHATLLPTNVSTTEIRQVNHAFNQLFVTLNQAQKERNIMLAGISHDLRTPLTRMRLSAEMLDDDFLKEGLIYDIEDMDAILEQFISFMKDGSDEPTQQTDLNSIFHEIIVQFSPAECQTDIHDLPLIPLRSLSIKRLLVNLINNAHRYGKPPIVMHAHIQKKSEKTLKHDINVEDLTVVKSDEDITDSLTTEKKISQQLAQEATEELVISVYDHGEGVADEDMERILQPFERGNEARTIQGSGLGLSIVNRIAKLHYGHVEVKNHPDGGFFVQVYIPIIKQ